MSELSCRVCQSHDVAVAGRVEYLAGFPSNVIDCRRCGCRIAADAAALHAGFHAIPSISYYATYRSLLDECRRLFASRDRAGIETLLRKNAKYDFVLDQLSAMPAESRVLEWGCSRGYLASASLLAGRKLLGVDVAPDAIAAARDAFGDHFVTDGSPRIDAEGPYDAIYHVGLIGCVPDPLTLTRRLIGLLKPGGRLLFNAPNRDAMHRRGQLWLDSSPPPDLITLFPTGFWRAHAESGVSVIETPTPTSAAESTVKTLQRWFGAAWQPPTPSPHDSPSAHHWVQPAPSAAWRLFEAAVAKFSVATGVRAGRWPEEFGTLVVMTRS